ncbi:MAG: hypothetical protein EP330_07470 [Deltaproteobacteria bacterium]|nr:MAG: hypothetical protein EP330_07470 [Deltaproteobacteria bacterium]
MSKTATISSLVRQAAKSEQLFTETSQAVLEEESHERIADFFDKLNIPRSTGSETNFEPIPSLTVTPDRIGSFEEEQAISNGIQKYLDRHERKIKWHATHPSVEGTENVLFVFRMMLVVTDLRLQRIEHMLKSKDELSPMEWGVARESMNKTYLSFRRFLNLTAGMWLDAMLQTVPREQLGEVLGGFHEFLDEAIAKLEEARTRIEDRRQELAVLPEGFPAVKPPVYFGGDLLARGPWKLFWSQVVDRAAHFREAA